MLDHRALVLLHQTPQERVDEHPFGLDLGDRHAGVAAPEQRALDVDRRATGVAANHAPQQLRRGLHVGLAILEDAAPCRTFASAPRRCPQPSLACRCSPSRRCRRRDKQPTGPCAPCCESNPVRTASGCCWSPDRRRAGRERAPGSATSAPGSRSARPRRRRRPPRCQGRCRTVVWGQIRRAIGGSSARGADAHPVRRPPCTGARGRSPSSTSYSKSTTTHRW